MLQYIGNGCYNESLHEIAKMCFLIVKYHANSI